MRWNYEQTSYVEYEKEELRIGLSGELFDETLWANIKAWFQTKMRSNHWLSAPFRVMTAEEAVPGYPRWKQMRVDVLSWIIFHLLVPSGHRLVQLWRTIDWAAINRLCADIYKNSESGQRAWAPAQLIALLILFCVLPIPSECELMRTVAIVPVYRWFCGFGLFGKLPDHSTLHTFRKHVGAERLEAILSLVVLQSLEAGLIANELLHFDMMGAQASARAWRPYERAVLLTQALLRYLELSGKGKAGDTSLTEVRQQVVAEVALDVVGNKRLKENPKTAKRVLSSVERWTRREQATNGQALWQMALEKAVQTLLVEEAQSELSAAPAASQETKAQRRWLKKVAQRLKSLLPHARGDLDACVRMTSRVSLMCGYWLGFLVDGLHGVITAVRVVPLSIGQRQQMITALDLHQQRVGAYPKAVAADSAQDYYPVHRALDERQIQGHIASRAHQGVGGGFGSAHFTLDELGNLYCPAEKCMTSGKPRKDDGRIPYRASAADCTPCSLKDKCLPKAQQPDGPRVIYLEPRAHQRWLQNREHTRTQEYKAAQKKRFASEGWFGLAVRLYGANKMPYRSAPMNRIAGLMIGISMNLVLLTRHGRSP